jgi:hypothetical protein
MGTDPFRLVGTTIAGKYRIDRMVGEGGFGVVYQGFHLNFEQPIALKCLTNLKAKGWKTNRTAQGGYSAIEATLNGSSCTFAFYSSVAGQSVCARLNAADPTISCDTYEGQPFMCQPQQGCNCGSAIRDAKGGNP